MRNLALMHCRVSPHTVLERNARLRRGENQHSRLEGAPPCALRRLIDHFAAHHSHNNARVFDSLRWDAEEVIREDYQVAEFPG